MGMWIIIDKWQWATFRLHWIVHWIQLSVFVWFRLSVFCPFVVVITCIFSGDQLWWCIYSGSLPLYCFNLQLLFFILVNKISIYLLALEMASPGNQHCAKRSWVWLPARAQLHNNLGQVIHTLLPLSPTSASLLLANQQCRYAAVKVTVDLALH